MVQIALATAAITAAYALAIGAGYLIFSPLYQRAPVHSFFAVLFGTIALLGFGLLGIDAGRRDLDRETYFRTMEIQIRALTLPRPAAPQAKPPAAIERSI